MAAEYSPYLGPIDPDDPREVVIVFTVGKVASKTVVESLTAIDDLPYRVYHAHVLSQSIETHLSADSQSKNFESTNEYLKFNLALSNFVNQQLDQRKWKLITLVREPLSIILSSFFEFLDIGKSIQQMHPEIFKDGNLDVTLDKFTEFYSSKFAYMTGDYIINWFDLELMKVFGLNVYNYPFPHKKGYSVISKGNLDLLIVRVEDLNKVFEESLEKFLGVSDVKMVKENIGDSRHFSKHMSFLKKCLKPHSHVLDYFYGSKFAMHFYSEDEIESYRKKWESTGHIQDSDFENYGISVKNIFDGLELWDKPVNK